MAQLTWMHTGPMPEIPKARIFISCGQRDEPALPNGELQTAERVRPESAHSHSSIVEQKSRIVGRATQGGKKR